MNLLECARAHIVTIGTIIKPGVFDIYFKVFKAHKVRAFFTLLHLVKVLREINSQIERPLHLFRVDIANRLVRLF